MKKYIPNITLITLIMLLIVGCSSGNPTQTTESTAEGTKAESMENSSTAEETTQPVETTGSSEEATDWFTPTLSEQDVTGQGFLGANGDPYIMDGEVVTIPIYFNAINDGETARITVDYGAFERIIHDSGLNVVEKHWLEQDEEVGDGDSLWWYQSDDEVKLCSGTVWGHALIEKDGQTTGYAVFLLEVPVRGWSGSEIIREVRFDEVVTEAQALEEIEQVIEAYSENNEALECVTEVIGGVAGESGSGEEEQGMVRFEMTEAIYDVRALSIEKLENGQYAFCGGKYYPDIVLTDDQMEGLKKTGLLCGFIGDEEMFRIYQKSGIYWFRWGDEEYAVQFVQRSLSDGANGWMMGVRNASSPVGNHNYGPLEETFELIVSAEQIVAGVQAQSWGITSETLTAEEIYEIYVGYGNHWTEDWYEGQYITLRVYETAEGLEIEITYRP